MYALKILQKDRLVATKQVQNVRVEKQVLELCDHPFITRLVCTIKDKSNLYFLLEYLQGGELFNIMTSAPYGGKLTLVESRFYMGCVVSALAHLHRKNVLYRDLKPENMLIDEKGYIKFCDFGLAKRINLDKGQQAFTVCGTTEYLAPELIKGRGYDAGVDWWAAGILIYEMLFARTPFADASNNPMKICRKILEQPVAFPAGWQRERQHATAQPALKQAAEALIRGLTHPRSARRWGTSAGGIGKIINAPFFSDLDWDQLLARSIKCPGKIPEVKNPLDTSNFEPISAADEQEFMMECAGAASSVPESEWADF